MKNIFRNCTQFAQKHSVLICNCTKYILIGLQYDKLSIRISQFHNKLEASAWMASSSRLELRYECISELLIEQYSFVFVDFIGIFADDEITADLV